MAQREDEEGRSPGCASAGALGIGLGLARGCASEEDEDGMAPEGISQPHPVPCGPECALSRVGNRGGTVGCVQPAWA